MESNNSKYLCPFCVSTWDCDGPHVEQQHLESFSRRLHYMKEDLALLAIEIVQEHSAANGYNSKTLEETIYKKLMSRSI